MRSIHIPDHHFENKMEKENPASINYAVGLLVTASLILLFGLTMLYSTSYGTAGSTYFVKQLVWSGVGMSAAFFIFFVGYKTISNYSPLFILGVILLLIIADFCFPAVKGANRWIKIPGMGNIQPSEFAKIAVVLFLSKYCAEKMRYINELSLKKGIFPAICVCVVVIGLVFAGKDWGTTFLISSVAGLMLFAAGIRLLFLLIPLLLLVPAAIAYLRYFDPERWSRMTTFLHPEAFHKSDGYQLWNSQLALGSGGFSGLGFMGSRMKAKYLPEAHTDFILSIVGEELGFVCLVLVILAYIAFMYFAIKISVNSNNKQGMLLGFGITSVLVIQAIINIGVISGALPTKGMPAPFISYGGSNLVMSMMSVGLLMSIGIESAYPNLNKEILSDFKSRLTAIKVKCFGGSS
jgi:cell division protein FtsW